MMEKFTRDEMKELATKAGFHFHDAGHMPIEHTDPLKYSEECFVRFTKMIINKAASALYNTADDPDIECQYLLEYFDIEDAK